MKSFLKTLTIWLTVSTSIILMFIFAVNTSLIGANATTHSLALKQPTEETISLPPKKTTNDVHDLESLINCMFGNINIAKAEYLYNLDETNDYIYVEFENNGYAVYFKDTLELLEYSAQGKIDYPNTSENKYYGGPGKYFVKQNNTFSDIKTNAAFNLPDETINDYSNKVRTLLMNNYENKNIKKCNIPTSINMSEIELLANDETPKANDNLQECETGSSAPSYDRNNLIRVTDGAYIDHHEYFLTDPLHGYNMTGTCGAVATQLLLSYNNYYNDRRIIANNYLNGDINNLEDNPNTCTDPTLMTPETLGTRGYYEDGSDQTDIKNSYFKYVVDKVPAWASVNQVKEGINSILTERNNEIDGTIKYTVSHFQLVLVVESDQTRLISPALTSACAPALGVNNTITSPETVHSPIWSLFTSSISILKPETSTSILPFEPSSTAAVMVVTPSRTLLPVIRSLLA